VPVGIEQGELTAGDVDPDRDGTIFGQADHQGIGPDPAHVGAANPRQVFQGSAQGSEIDVEEGLPLHRPQGA